MTKSEVFELAQEIVTVVSKHTSSMVKASAALRIAETIVLAEWEQATDSKLSEEALSSR
jgi:hypothetical protein